MMDTKNLDTGRFAVNWLGAPSGRTRFFCLVAFASLALAGCASPTGQASSVAVVDTSSPAVVSGSPVVFAPPSAAADPEIAEASVAHAAGPETAAAASSGARESLTVTESPDADTKDVSGSPAVETSVEEEPDLAAIEAEWGIRILGLRWTVAGHMLDFRYRVIDPEKALPLFDRDEKPHLIHQDSGTVVSVPNAAKIGPLRNSDEPIAGRNFFILFNNPGAFIQRGEKVTVVVGDFEVKNLSVQ